MYGTGVGDQIFISSDTHSGVDPINGLKGHALVDVGAIGAAQASAAQGGLNRQNGIRTGMDLYNWQAYRMTRNNLYIWLSQNNFLQSFLSFLGIFTVLVGIEHGGGCIF